jgi:hypothetical protein
LIAFNSLALCLIVAAVESRSETGMVLTTGTFDSKQMNWAAGPVITRQAGREVVSLPSVPGEHVTYQGAGPPTRTWRS